MLAGFSSCKEEADIWDESSAQRTSEAVSEYGKLLTDAQNGWVMEYFANNNESGYPFLVKFSTDGSVTVAAKNQYSSANAYKEETSLYQVIADMGPVISFDSFNTLLHVFSDPAAGPDPSNDLGTGHGGDYEFVVEEGSADHFRLRGKKTGFIINMYKLADDVVWKDYYTNLDASKEKLFNSKIKTLILTVGDKQYTLKDMSTGVLSIVPVGGDAITETLKSAYIVYADGTIHLLTPFKGIDGAADFAVQDFRVGENGALNCINEGQSASIAAKQPSDLFLDTEMKWRFDPTTAKGAFATTYQKVVEQSKSSAFKQTFRFFEFRYNRGNYGLYFENGKYKSYFYFDIVAGSQPNTVKFTYKAAADITASRTLELCPAYQEFIDLLTAGEFTVTSDGVLTPTAITMTNGENAFTAKAQ